MFDEVYRNYMVISWNPPLDDGGCPISTYIVEKRDTNRELWMPVTSSCTRTSCKVPKLIEGRDYIIRICAQNIYGISNPLLSAETKAKDVFSKLADFLDMGRYLILVFYYNHQNTHLFSFNFPHLRGSRCSYTACSEGDFQGHGLADLDPPCS